MLREPLSRRNLLSLRAAIKGYSAESVILRKKKQKKQKPLDKDILAIQRVFLGLNTRHHHLAHAFLRGLDYKQVEKTTTTKWTEQDLNKIFMIIKVYSPWVAYYMQPTDISDWINTGKRFFLTKEEMTAKIQAQKEVEMRRRQAHAEYLKRMEEKSC